MKIKQISIGTDDALTLWEMYEIHPTLPIKVAQIGSWNTEAGLFIEETRKWIRRHDLEVNLEMNDPMMY